MKKRVPKYVYYCSECEQYSEVRHSMSKTLQVCPACELEDTLTRVPSTPVALLNQGQQIEPETGNLVKEFIEENKKSLKKMKEEGRKEMNSE